VIVLVQPTLDRTWVVLTFGEDRQHAGNAGYDDAPEKWYSYDSYVANHRQVAPGNCLILCDRNRALGVARAITIDKEPGTRVLQRCPECADTGIKRRIAKQPAYRCKKGHEFEEPVSENASCTKYTAHFGGTFKPFAELFGRNFLRQGCPRYSDQAAMQEFEFARIETEFRTRFPEAAQLIAGFTSELYLQAETAEDVSSGEAAYRPAEGDERATLLRQIRARRGQQAFRDKLRTRYGDQCLVSGCEILHVLEAAHICPYGGEPDNHTDNGLLLRADIHTLFDLDLIGIEPLSLRVHFRPEVNAGEYKGLDGRVLFCSGGNRPSEKALEIRWKAFTKRTRTD
jgi:putative restriction endonuclease